jgi:hypothetical protein
MYYTADPLASRFVNISDKKYARIMIKVSDQFQKIIEAMN